MGLRTWSIGELEGALGDPGCFERWSPLTGDPVLVVDLESVHAGETRAEAVARLALLPAVSIGIGAGDHATAARVDVRVADEAAAAAVSEAVSANPLASVALVQLLRRSEPLSVEQAILAESVVYSTLQSGPEFAAWLAGHERREIPASSEPAVRIDREGGMLHLRLNRPEKRNAFSAEVRDALCEALQFVLRDQSVERVEWSGEGRAFCSGGDLDEFGTLPDPATAHVIRSTRSVGILLAECAGRVHARLHGACIGAGIELPALCSHVSATPDAFFALPEVGMGLVPGAGGTASLPRRIGRQRTAWLALTNQRIDAETALAWGLVDQVASR